MTLASVAGGFYFPHFTFTLWDSDGTTASSFTLDAATEKLAFIGRCYIEGRAASKTISAAGGGSIAFRTGAVTFANGATTVDVGIQDVAAGAGPPAQPDGTFDVKSTQTGGGGGISANSWNTISMTGGSGTKTISHGDLIAIVLDMTARGGADSVNVQYAVGNYASAQLPIIGQNTGAWAQAIGLPTAVITFDDGTLGIIDGSLPGASISTTIETYGDATNPDERGNLFQVPWDCKIDAFYALAGNNNDAAADYSLKLYSDPLGTPSAIATIAILAEQGSVSAAATPGVYMLSSEVSLTRNTNYALTILAQGNSIDQKSITLGDTNYRKFYEGGTTLKKVTRDGSTGAFTAEDPAVTLYPLSVRISSLHDTGGGAGGGLLAHPGMRGGFI